MNNWKKIVGLTGFGALSIIANPELTEIERYHQVEDPREKSCLDKHWIDRSAAVKLYGGVVVEDITERTAYNMTENKKLEGVIMADGSSLIDRDCQVWELNKEGTRYEKKDE